MTNAPRPVLLTSVTSAAILDGRGDLELARETRGTTVDWGGAYGQLVRLTGPWRLALVVGAAAASLGETQVDSHLGPEGWQSRHRWQGLELEQNVSAIADPPGVVRVLRVTHSDSQPVTLKVENRWSPFLLPVLVEGIRPIRFRVESRQNDLHVRQREFALSFRSSVLPSHLYLNGGSWLGGRFEGPVREVGSDHELTIAPGSVATVSWLVHGGLERELGRSQVVDALLDDPSAATHAQAERDAAWTARTPTLGFPDAPELERAYSMARAALRRLYAEPGEGLVGLVAGYPWYSAIWCRDLAWMLPAVLWLGDFDWAQRSLDSVYRFQAHADIPILGGSAGELPMQIGIGPIFLFGTSDTTLYYPGITDQLVRHSGRTELIDQWFPVIERILAWGEARTDPSTGLIHNGGEAQSVGAVKGPVARVHYGINAPDTTIWDSTDRRPHAVDLQVLWHQALSAGARWSSARADAPRGARWASMADRIPPSVRERYGWPEESYLFDSVGPAGPVRKLRPNALRVVSMGWLDPGHARSVVERAARNDLSTDWGLRTLSEQDASYDPQAYHDGQVWTIATAWAADAAFAAGSRELAMRYLGVIARHLLDEQGYANECYRGDRAEPFNSCFLLGFSIAPFLTTLFERLWGLRIDAPGNRLEVRPAFPATWTAASMHELRIATGSVDLDWSPGRLAVRWKGPGSLTVATSRGERVVPAGSSAKLPLD